MLGVSGAKSFSGFMVAAPGVPRSLATPQPGSRRVAPGARGVCGSALPPASAHGPRHPGPACLAPPPRAALGNRAWNPPPHTCFQPPNSSRDQFPPRTCRTCRAQRAAAIFLGPHDFAAVSVFRLEGPPLASHAPTQAASGLAPPPARLHLSFLPRCLNLV